MLRSPFRLLVVLLVFAVVGAGAAFAVLHGTGRDDTSSSAGRSGRFVTAAERFKPDHTKVGDCAAGKVLCIEQAYGNMAYRDGARATLRELATHIGQGDNIDSDCHRIAHSIGYGELLRVDGKVGKAFAEGDSTCWSGYFHGVLESAFAGVPNSRLAPVATTLCTSADVRATQFLHYQCVHGLGHGLMLHTNYELPAALKVCEQFKDAWESSSCDSGVFMENISTSRGAVSKYVRKDNLIYPCNVVAERHKLYCYLMVTSRINEANGFQWKQTAQLCATKAQPDWRDECFQSYGRDASGQSRHHVAPVLEHCSPAYVGAAWSGECVYGAARDMTSEDAGPERAARFCAALGDAPYAPRCANGVGTIIATLRTTPEERVADCRSAFRAAGVEQLAKECGVGAGVIDGAAVGSPA